MKSLKFYLVILAVLIFLYLLAQFNRPKAVNWDTTFSSNDKIPFGTYVVFNRINDIFPQAKVTTFREPVYNVLNDYGITNGTYVIISNSIGLNKYDYQKLIKFIQHGNDVFMSASDFGPELTKKLKVETSEEFKDVNSAATAKLTNKYLDTNKVFDFGKGTAESFFNNFDTSSMVVLGKNSFGHVNFLKYHFGNGNLYLNSVPLAFTNYSLLNSTGNEYAAKALSYLKTDTTVLWDQYYALGRDGDGSIMRVFLRNNNLRWAFYIAFFSLIIFVLYDIKRRQRMIPIMEPLANSTLDFVNVVGQVYYEKRNNANIAHKKISYLLEHLRDEYQFKTSKLDKDFVDKLISKLGIERSLAADLVAFIQNISAQQHVSDNELIELNKLIEKFYTQSR